MRSDYIVPEGSGRRELVTRPKVIAGGLAFVAAMLAAGQWGSDNASDAPNDSSVAAADAVDVASSPPREKSSLLSELAPISRANASMSAPPADAPLPELPTLSSLPPSFTVPADPTLEIPALQAEEAASAEPEQQWQTRTVKVAYGDSLSALFDREGLRSADWIALSRMKGEARRLSRLQPGDELTLALDAENKLMQLKLRLDELSTLRIARDAEGGFEQALHTDAVETRSVSTDGVIDSSLFLSAKAAGLSDRLTMELTDIFAWDIDFVLDIRNGDSFKLVYEEVLRDGEKIKDGNILAAEFVNRGKIIQAVRYTDENGRSAYYSPDGHPMKKAFLRNPVDFTRISSGFSLGRKHPILNKIRAHKGVDYAAPSGTPIKAAGNGKVTFAGVKGGYGNVVMLQHAGKYTTVYAHLKSFRRGIRRGASVSQGQTIGYVGMSGLATGPHLHYEFRINDRHVNPLSVKLPSAPRIASSELARFKSQTQSLLAELQQPATGTEVADAR